jgi:D-proline reductase (dithiol) PrdB
MFHRWVGSYSFVESEDVPWTPLTGPVMSSRLTLITTGGVHLRSDAPFDMQDPAGDPSFREIPADAAVDDLMITHNYYDHRDADKDINIVLPLDRVRELASYGEIGVVNHRHFSFMGHILQPHLETLIQRTSREVAQALVADNVDLAILTPT